MRCYKCKRVPVVQLLSTRARTRADRNLRNSGQSWNRVRVSRVGSGSGSKLISSNFVRNFFKFNDLILFFEDYKAMSPALSNITEDNNPLLFWRDAQRRFPILSQLAKMLFVAQCSNAQSERDFSSCGLIALTERRTLLFPETVEALEILYSAEKHTKQNLFD